MAELPKNIFEIKKILDEIKYPGSVVIKKSASAGSGSTESGSAAPINDPVVNVQRRKEEAAQPKAASVPSQSQIRADAAKKNLERYLKSDQRKEFQKKQQQNLHAQAILTGITDGQWTPEVDETEKKIRNEIDYWEAEVQKERDRATAERDMAEVEQWDEADRAELERYIKNKNLAFVQSLNQSFTGLPAEYENSPLIQKYGRERLDEIASTYQREQNRKKYEDAELAGREAAGDGWFNGLLPKFLPNAASIGANLADTLLDPLQRIAQGSFGNDERYTTLDPYAGGQARAYASGVRGQNVENIQGDVYDEEGNLIQDGGKLRELGAIAYQGAMSAADTAARSLVAGTPTVGAGLAALGSFNSTLSNASAQGATPEQALALATINSGIEAATEKLPLDELFKVAKGGAKPAAQVVKNVLKQMGIEILEEEASLIGTTLAEAAILQEKSGYNQQIMKAAAMGVPYEQAKAEADRALLAEAINTALVSGVAGLFGAAGAEYAGARYVGDTSQQEATETPQTAQAEEQTQTQEKAEQPVQEAQKQPQAAQEVPTQAQPEQRSTVDVLTETITGKKQEAQAKQTEQNRTPASADKIIDILHEQKDAGKKTAFSFEGYKVRKYSGGSWNGEPYFSYRIETPDGRVIKGETAYSNNAFFADVADAIAADMNPNQVSTQQVDTQEQSSEGGQVKGTGAAERNFSGVAAYEDMLSDDNVQRQRSTAVRDVEMPKLDSDGRRVTEFAGNAVSAGVTPDSMADAIKSLVGDKQLSFDTRTNKQSLENAAKAIKENGDTAVISALHTNAENKTIVDGDIEKGLVLYAQYANNQDPKSQETAAQLIVDMAAIANMSGRNIQLFSLMKRMTPEGQLMTVRKNIERTIADINKGRSARKQITYVPGQKNLDAAKTVAQKRRVEIDQTLEQNFLNAKTDDQREAALDDIYKNVATQIRPTLGEAWDAWRNLAMLGNFKTHERNFFSTGAFKPYTAVKRTIGTALESVLLKQEDRTKSLVGISKEAHDLVNWAKKDAQSDAVRKLMGGAGTTGDEARSAIQEYRKILPGFLDTARKKNLELMEAEDFVFKRSEYAVSLATFLKARGYNIKQVQNGEIPNGVMEEARQHAIKEAQKATFNDRNALSDKITELSAKIDNIGPVAKLIRKGIVPFLKAPANVVKRIAEYNPLSLAKTIVTAKGDIDSGRKTAADVIDEVSAGLTGTAAMGLGAALAAGLVPGVKLVGAIEDEEEKRAGAQEYSIQIGDEYYSVAWLAPAMIPLFMGANLYNKFSNWDADADGWDLALAVLDVGKDTIDPMLELSMLSSLNDFVDTISNEEKASDKAMAAMLNAATSYFTQGLPTVFGQIEQATETEKSTTYVNTGNELERTVKKTIANATKRLPGDAYQTAKLDEWGEPVKNSEDWMKRTFDAFLNPFTTSTKKTDEITTELSRLNKVQTENVTPPTAGKTLSYTDKDGNAHKDVRLTEEQYQTLARTQGQTAKRILDEMIASKDYKALSDEQKALAIQQAYSYARKTAEIAAIEDHTGYDDAWMIDMQGRNEATYIMRRIANNSLNSAFTALDTAWDKGYNEKGRSDRLEWAYEAFKAMTPQAKKEVKEWATGTTAKYIEARENGITHDQFLSAAENVAKVTGTGSNGTVRDIDRRQAIAKTSGLTEQQKDKIMKVYMEDYDPADDSPATTELKYDYIRHGLGLTAEQYAETYRASLDHSKKNDKIAAIMELGYDKKTATALYNVYGSTTKGKTAYMGYYNSK